MTKEEALKLVQDALEALENISTALREDDVLGSDIELLLNTITSIHKALAQSERDPWREAAAHPKIDPWREAVAQPEERNFCPRCGKRTADLTTVHTCTPPYNNALQRGLARTKEVVAGAQAFYGFPNGSVSASNAGGKCVTAGETAPLEPT